jgi:hypothetical protein
MVKNAGICDFVNNYLKRHSPLVFDEICFRMPQYTRGAISGALSTLFRNRRIHRYGDKKNATYSTRFRTEEKHDAPKRYVPEMRPLRDSGLLDGWKRCVRDPYDEHKHDRRLVR